MTLDQPPINNQVLKLVQTQQQTNNQTNKEMDAVIIDTIISDLSIILAIECI